jgi:hypothetical protein
VYVTITEVHPRKRQIDLAIADKEDVGSPPKPQKPRPPKDDFPKVKFGKRKR